jgi:hypothetical protein
MLSLCYIAVGWSETHIFLWAHRTWKLWQRLSYVIIQWNLILKTCVYWHLNSHRCYQTTLCQMQLLLITFTWNMFIHSSLLFVLSSPWNQMRYVYKVLVDLYVLWSPINSYFFQQQKHSVFKWTSKRILCSWLYVCNLHYCTAAFSRGL